MHDYQYNLEVVSVVPDKVLTGTADGLRHKLILHCSQRDATMDCTVTPSTFEVRNAPALEYVSISLVALDDAGGTQRVEASLAEPLLVGGLHRIVGAEWVALSSTSLVDSVAEASSPVCRVFVVWSMTRMDGCPVRTNNVETSLTETPLPEPAPAMSPLMASLCVPSSEKDCSSPNRFNSTQRDVAAELQSAQANTLKVTATAAPTTTTTTNTFAATSAARPHPWRSRAVDGLGLPTLSGVGYSVAISSPLIAVEAPSYRGSRWTESTIGPLSTDVSSLSVLISRLVLDSSVANPEISAAGQTARVSIALDEEQEESQQRPVNDCGDACRAPSDHAGGFTAAAHDPLHRGSAADVESSRGASATSALSGLVEPQVGGLQDAVLEQFPFCSVSLTSKAEMAASSPDAPMSVLAVESSANTAHVEEGAQDTDASTAHADFLQLDPAFAVTDARAVTRVDYYASSTQAIGAVPLQTRLQNLYTVPSPQVLDRLKDQLAPPSLSPSSSTAEREPVTSHGLWGERPRPISFSRSVGSSGSAQEEIRREHEARRSCGALLTGLQIDDRDSSASLLTSSLALVKGHYVEARTESALSLLRWQALEGLRRRLIMY
ncbi:hypothetical protein LPMP_322000 [Leishmania panamensis]|uniref:Uncharacterized protein n=1 Tax=Leishmania panamensis TaxID=5679 RepID=A0A088RYL6_LEIPA|nr:hypothetical protein LPMP_322000 [Leishmania panamensis]AIO01084.1 hypothetical protein LPMP_322000 [Leishmania panamensis]